MTPFTPPQQSSQLPEWFDKTPVNIPLPRPAKPRRHRKTIYIVLGIMMLLAAIGGASYYFLTRTNCLTTNDYREISSLDLPVSLDPTVTFYSHSFTFQTGSTEYSSDGDSTAQSQISKLGDFYKSHASKPLVFTITYLVDQSGNTSSSIKDLTTQRTNHLMADLTASGIPSSLITIQEEPYTVTVDEGAPLANDSVTLALTSSSACH